MVMISGTRSGVQRRSSSVIRRGFVAAGSVRSVVVVGTAVASSPIHGTEPLYPLSLQTYNSVQPYEAKSASKRGKAAFENR